jgi:polyribonucleotide nucleotidyltransferase
VTLLEGPEIQFSEAVIDNGRFGKRVIRFETGRLAKQAAGAAMVYIDEDTALLSATTAGKHPREGFDFFPLTVDVEERMYAAGRIPGSFFRREGRPSTEAILACRLMDRPLRPAFVKGLRNEVQIVVTVLAINPDELYDVVAINASSMSTQLSGLPFSGRSAASALPSSPTSRVRSGLPSRSTPSLRTPCSTWSLPAVLPVTTSPS